MPERHGNLTEGVEMMTQQKSRRTAFALAGVGGNNAHGAGFLAAAQRRQQQRTLGADGRPGGLDPQQTVRANRRILPELEFISCTSGAIAYVAAYLKGDDVGADLERRISAAEQANPLPRGAWTDAWRGFVTTLFTGVPGVFGPWIHAFLDHLQERALGFIDPVSPFYGLVPTTLNEFNDLWFPARMLVPEIPAAFFADVANVFNDRGHGVGVAFNSFDPKAGMEQLYVNDAALTLIANGYDRAADYGRTHRHTVYKPITADGVQAALRLFYYGFPNDRIGPDHSVDGAYARSIILNELTCADRIYAVKPTNDRWLGRLPQNWFEVQDMQTEFWLETSYREQCRLIGTINDLYDAGRLCDHKSAKPHHAEPSGIEPAQATADGARQSNGSATRIAAVRAKNYRHVELVPVEIGLQRDFFTYFVEDREVFREAYGQSLRLLADYDEGDTVQIALQDTSAAPRVALTGKGRTSAGRET